jgi:putative membrane protein
MRILSLQVIVFVIAALLLSQGPILRLLTPRAVQRRRAHRAAMEQFFIRGLASTPNRMGVMIFVSMAERYARIIADEGIARLVPHEEWQDIVDALIAQAKAGRIADGFVEAVARTGDKLSKHAPPDGTGDALPNRIYVI